jgi:hypothetical protein
MNRLCREFQLEVDVTRADLVKQGYTREMTDEDMERLAEILAERYYEGVFLEDLTRAMDDLEREAG